MSLAAVVVAPVLFALIFRLFPPPNLPRLLTGVALIDVGLSLGVAYVWSEGPAIAPQLGGWFLLDPTSVLFLVLVNLVFFTITVHVWSRVRAVPALLSVVRSFAPLSLLFMATVNALLLCQHLVLMWALLELSTLLAAPLVLEAGTGSSRRAGWTYLLFSTLSLALVMLGILCLEASQAARHVEGALTVTELSEALRGKLDLWQRLGGTLILFGLGSKLGLAPLYGWLPETYDAAPPSVTALLAAVQANGVMLMVFRAVQIFRDGGASFISVEFLLMGSLSLAVATMNIVATDNYKRLIAYASISSSGVIAIGLSLGGNAAYGVVLYVVSNAFVKAILFLTAGKLKAAYGTKYINELGGALKQMPYSGLIFTIGTFALLGFPPFGSFMAEMLILSGAVQSGHYGVFVLFGGALTIIFVATGRSLFPMVWGESKRQPVVTKESMLPFVPKLLVIVVLVALGVYPPEPVTQLLRSVAGTIGGP
ncbi:MAG: proton-conducting transporter membrane subunit [Myxococcota bacterium]